MSNSNMEQLDETGFEFPGADGRQYLCRMIDGQPWFCYKHPDGQWVTLRPVNQTEVWQAYDQRPEMQDEVKQRRESLSELMKSAAEPKLQPTNSGTANPLTVRLESVSVPCPETDKDWDSRKIDRLCEVIAIGEEQIRELQSELEGYKEAAEDKKRLTREIDVIMNGKDAAKQASLCDVVGQLRDEFPALRSSVAEKEELAEGYLGRAVDLANAAAKIAKERDEFRNALDLISEGGSGMASREARTFLTNVACAVLAKYPKPRNP